MSEINSYITESLDLLNLNNFKFIENNLIIDFNKNNKIVYNYEYIENYQTSKKITHYILVLNQDKNFQYQEWYGNIDNNLKMIKSQNINTIIEANDIITSFIRDTYYDSPINYKQMIKISQDEKSFYDNYKKYNDYFYIGFYKEPQNFKTYVNPNINENKLIDYCYKGYTEDSKIYRIYVKLSKEDGYSNTYDYIVE